VIEMPFADFEDFDECLNQMLKKYGSKKIAQKVCGRLYQQFEKKHKKQGSF